MDAQFLRRTDRISVAIPSQVTGKDRDRVSFIEETRTLVVSGHGGKILLNRALAPEQEVSIRCMVTGQETSARIVGQIREDSNGFYYGLAFLDPAVNIWGIDFPPLAESKNATLRLLLSCGQCRHRELVYLGDLEAEVFEANRAVSRTCRECRETTLWWESTAKELSEKTSSRSRPFAKAQSPVWFAPPTPPGPRNERRNARLNIHVRICVRHPWLGEDVITSANVSKGGVAFKSRKLYAMSQPIEVAVPYIPGGANIFISACIRHVKEIGKNLYNYGAEYDQQGAELRS